VPIIKRKEKLEKVFAGFRLDAVLVDKLKKYGEYTNVAPAEIVATAITHVINSDPEFLLTICNHSDSKPAVIGKPGVKPEAA
jgi:hypothetical protein